MKFGNFNLEKLLKNNLVRLVLLVAVAYIGYTYFVKSREGLTEGADSSECTCEEGGDKCKKCQAKDVAAAASMTNLEGFRCGCDNSVW